MRLSKLDLRELRSAKVGWRGVLQQMHLRKTEELVELQLEGQLKLLLQELKLWL